jgi:hypothetical protein
MKVYEVVDMFTYEVGEKLSIKEVDFEIHLVEIEGKKEKYVNRGTELVPVEGLFSSERFFKTRKQAYAQAFKFLKAELYLKESEWAEQEIARLTKEIQ